MQRAKGACRVRNAALLNCEMALQPCSTRRASASSCGPPIGCLVQKATCPIPHHSWTPARALPSASTPALLTVCVGVRSTTTHRPVTWQLDVLGHGQHVRKASYVTSHCHSAPCPVRVASRRPFRPWALLGWALLHILLESPSVQVPACVCRQQTTKFSLQTSEGE